MRMGKRKAAVVSGVVLAAVLAGMFGARKSGGSARPAGEQVAAREPGPRVKWPAGRFAYSLSWTADTQGQVAESADQGPTLLALRAAIEGEIALERVGGGERGARLALSYTRIDKYAFSMQGNDSRASAAELARALVGKTAYLDVDERGRIESISYAEDADNGQRIALRSLALELNYTLPEAAAESWTAEEEGSLGRARVQYQKGASTLLREPLRYTRLDAAVEPALAGAQELKGGAELALDGAGVPLSIDDSETVRYTRRGEGKPAVDATWSFKLRRTGVAPPGRQVARASAAQPLGEPVADPGRRERMDRRMAEGVSLDTALSRVDAFAAGAKMPHDQLVKIGAWLRLHPEEMPRLVEKFEEPAMQRRGHEAVLDVLVACGSPQAQKAMREALSSDAAKAAPQELFGLVQRFSFLGAPDAESVRFLEESYAGARAAQNRTFAEGALVALGSTVRQNANRNPALASEANGRVLSELGGGDLAMQRAALAALGNAAQPQNVSIIASYANDADGLTRTEAARALRSVDSPEARNALLQLAADPDALVAGSAFDSLTQQSLGDSDWRALDQLAQQQRTPVDADAELIDLVREKGATRSEAREILLALAPRNSSPDNNLQQVIRQLLDNG